MFRQSMRFDTLSGTWVMKYLRPVVHEVYAIGKSVARGVARGAGATLVSPTQFPILSPNVPQHLLLGIPP